MGTTIECFQGVGKHPDLIERLKMIESGIDIAYAEAFKRNAVILSGPGEGEF